MRVCVGVSHSVDLYLVELQTSKTACTFIYLNVVLVLRVQGSINIL